MIPRTKLQKLIVELSTQLPKITPEQELFGYEKCLDKMAYRNDANTHCLICGHTWKNNEPLLLTSIEGSTTCPACNQKLKLQDTNYRIFRQYSYLGIITTHKGFQVIRFFRMACEGNIGSPVEYSNKEIVQIWITSQGKYEIISRLYVKNCYDEYWIQNMQLRSKTNATNYNIKAFEYYPEKEIIPELKRNGFKDDYYSLTPFKFFVLLLSEPKAETLLKAKQYKLLAYLGNWFFKQRKEYWGSIKICLRNKYKIKDPSTWFDYLDLLKHFNKDVLNPKYICPKSLKKAHDKLVDKKNAIERKMKLEQQKAKLDADNKEYLKVRKKFLDLEFEKGLIKIVVLKSVHEFLIEGDKLGHCVYSNSYYKRSDSLIMSARINDEPIETIEVSLSNLKIIQSRGKGNNNTKYHKDIVSLVNQNMTFIKQRLRA